MNIEISNCIPDFRNDRAEFSDVDKYPDEVIYKALGMSRINFSKRWGEYKEFSRFRQGWFFYAAHTIFMTEQAITSAENNMLPGSTRGVDSTSIADESTTFGSQIMLQLKPWEDELASSWYGVRYLELKEPLKTIGFVI